MNGPALVEEAQALTARLNEVWMTNRHHSTYATRLVMLAQRAYYRHLRRAARCGDARARRWLTLLGTTVKI